MRFTDKSFAAAVSFIALSASLPAGAQEMVPGPQPGGYAPEPQCTTTYTVTTKCTGSAAPLALPEAQPQPAAPPAAYPQPYYPQPAYPQPAYPQPYYQQPAYPQPLYPGYVPPPIRTSHVEMQPNYGLVIAGLTIFGASYSWNAFGAYLAQEGKLAIPVAGPLFFLDHNDHGVNGLLVFDSLVQATGVVLFIAGVATKHKVTVWDSGTTKVSVVPTANFGGGGLAAVGTF